jgi:hypothetical protein
MQAKVEDLTVQAGLQIRRAILENEVTHRVGPPHRPNPTPGCVLRGEAAGLRGLCWTEDPAGPRVRKRKLQRAVRERTVAGLSTRNYRRAIGSVMQGYGIEKSSVGRQFVEASGNQRESAATLDRHPPVGSREEIPPHQRLLTNSVAKRRPESLTHSAAGGPQCRSRLNLIRDRLTAANIESRCNQLKLGHPRAGSRNR